MEEFNSIQDYLIQAQDSIIKYIPKILLAALVLWIGFKIVKKLVKWIEIALEKAGFNDHIRPFLISIIDVIFKAAILLAVASILGANLTGLIAVVAAAGFAIGMALQGSLGNFASGIIIMMLKPYKTGDWVTLGDKFGKVEEINLFSTVVVSPGQKTLIIPNSKVTDDIVINYSNKDLIRLDLEVTMPYDEDFPKVKQIILNSLKSIEKIKHNIPIDVGIVAYDSHSIRVNVLPFTHPDHFWEVTYEAYGNIKKAFSEHKIKVAYSEGVEMGRIGG